ncbi:MAG: HD domain-containing protein [Nanoarchaeota archaeon]|nr:HD domain-containing protein [Nanoarchaeota archaeon]MBU1005318.1 HD domain-containing protein [Nanoarchaeota archaeon]MBU1945510.1 HD domain-containing protein [Nanoarchaeota archaeon]
MKRLSEKEAIKLLKNYSKSEDSFKKVLAHSQAVKDVAFDIGKRVKNVDLNFIKSAALLHDIGRFQFGPNDADGIKHGVVGADILRKEGLFEHALAAERHIGAGISQRDIEEQGLPLPMQDYMPVSKEEKIICHADNLVFGDKVKSVDDAVERFSKEVSKKIGKRVKKLADDVEGMKND